MNAPNLEGVDSAAHGYQPPYPSPSPSPHHRSPLLAGFLSAIMPGLGLIYCGLYARAAIVFSVMVALFSSAIGGVEDAEMAILLPALAFTWFFGILDSYRQATLLNWGGAPPGVVPRLGKSTGLGGNLGLGVALVVIGLYGALRQVVDFDLSFLVEHWYLIALAFGAFMVFQAMRVRNDEAVEG